MSITKRVNRYLSRVALSPSRRGAANESGGKLLHRCWRAKMHRYSAFWCRRCASLLAPLDELSL
ncbi:hypothetical protein KCP73_13500 [Salmonella enterica subsp. enterica]|nr:hypothetical protein KCP73_13500 [Salmonella enterica subsp. enterica]